MLMMKAGVFRPAKLVSLRKVESKYSQITARSDGLRIGALTTLGQLERSAEVRKHAPLISHTLSRSPTCACAMSRRSAARSRTATRTWTCRRC